MEANESHLNGLHRSFGRERAPCFSEINLAESKNLQRLERDDRWLKMSRTMNGRRTNDNKKQHKNGKRVAQRASRKTNIVEQRKEISSKR